MTNKEILNIALQQSAIDCNCQPDDFLQDENVVVLSQNNDKARRYLTLPLECDLVSYGSNIVAQVSERTRDIVKEYINTYKIEHCFETPNMNVLNDRLAPFDLKVCFMAEYFLPDMEHLKAVECDYELRVLTQEDFAELYDGTWDNALCEKRKHLDVLGVGAYDQGKLIGLAGCSADCDTMWQIGVDVLKEYRRKNIASAITSRLALETFKRGKVPFYCCAWSNVKSARNAIKSGFRPAWVQMTVKDNQFVDRLNSEQKQYMDLIDKK